MTGSDSVPLLVLGYANADVIARVSRLPGDGDRVTASEIITYPGGMAANCACAAGLLGSDVRFLGNVGRDAFGAMLLDDFGRYGVDTTHAVRVDRTTTAIVTVTPEGERAIISEPTTYYPEGVQASLRASEGASGFLYLDGYHLGWAHAEAARARELGHTIYCDLDGAPDTYTVEEILGFLTSVDVVQWNPKIAGALFPAANVFDAAQEIAASVATVITTRGGDPLYLLHEGRSIDVPVPRAGEPVDTTGAGDIFAGAFLAFRASGAETEDAARHAVLLASESTRYSGARMPPEVAGRFDLRKGLA